MTPVVRGLSFASLILGAILLVLGLFYGDALPPFLQGAADGIGIGMIMFGMVWLVDFLDRKDS